MERPEAAPTSPALAPAAYRAPAVWSYFRPAHGIALAALLALILPPGWLSALAWERNLRWLFVLAVSALLAGLATPLCMALAFRWKILDIPAARKMHSVPIPRLGGLAVFAAAIFSTARNFQFSWELTGLVAGGSLIYVTGLVDDARGLSAKTRLWAQIAASLTLVAFGVRITFLPHMPGEAFLETLITVVWLVGLTNAFNFLDGIDGLASGMGALCALLFLAIAWPSRQSYVSFFTVALAGGCLGFLPYNWHKAKIFLGDAGSTFIGFTLAGLAVMGSWADKNALVALSTPLLILAIPIFDMIYTTVSRVRNDQVHNVKEWLEYVGKDHFHHRLLHLGATEVQTVGFILAVNLCLGLASITIRHAATPFGAGVLLFQSFLIFLMIVFLMLLGRNKRP